MFQHFLEEKNNYMAKIYLISPPNFDLNNFAIKLEEAFKTRLISMFQLRIKNYNNAEIIKYISKIKEICNNYKVLLIINDYYDLAIQHGCDGVHVGADDKNIQEIRRIADKNFIIGASCYDSRDLAIQSAENGASYLSFGTFYPSKTKNSKGKPQPEILIWAKNNFNIPIVAIGGINADNCINLLNNKADFLAIISYIWDHPRGIKFAIESIENIIKNL